VTGATLAQPASRGRTPGRLQRLYMRRERLILGIVGLVSILVVWEIASRLGIINRIIYSSPSNVFAALFKEFSSGNIWPHLAVSATEYFAGFGLAAVIGITLGFAAGWWRMANYILDPWITILYSAPVVALVPIIIFAFGIDLAAKAVIVFLICVFSIIVNTMIGVQQTGKQFLDVSRTFGASELKQITSVVLPGSVPYILTGLRLGGGHATVGVVVAELVAGNQGIGFVLDRAGSNLQSSLVMGVILLLGLWGVTFAELMGRLEGRFEAWRV
jgi:NitT/TauT family transport system permease protein